MLNYINIMGRLIKDPELKTSPNGTTIATFCLASDEGRRNEKGEYTTLFINCVAFNKRAEFLVSHFKKGNSAIVGGRLTSREYTNKDGIQVRTYEILADNIDFSGERPNKEEEVEPTEKQPENDKIVIEAQQSKGFNLDQIEVADDDLPW